MNDVVQSGELFISSHPASCPNFQTGRLYRGRSIANLLRMGHCAPSVMQTLLDGIDMKQERLVRLAAGLPGGIGDTGFECGGVTSPLIMLGLRYGHGQMHEGLPLVFYKGHEYCRRFTDGHGTLLCSEIRREARLPINCIGVVRHSPEYWAQTLAGSLIDDIPNEAKQAYSRLYAHLRANGFHCAHDVFRHLSSMIEMDLELFDATIAFMGGTLLKGMTCGAFVAAVMAVGLKLAEIENSRLRVLRMIGTMAFGGNAFSDGMNKFNRIMNIGRRLSERFISEFGSTQCREITQCNFSDMVDVKRYIENGCITRCRTITARTALMVKSILDELEGQIERTDLLF